MDLDALLQEIKTRRDELRLQMHLGSKEAQDEWEELQGEWDKFLSSSNFDQTAEEVGESARQLGLKMKEKYDALKKEL